MNTARVYDIKKVKDFNAEEKRQLMKDAYDLGFRYEHDYHGCSQAALGALQDVFGISNKAVFKAAHGLVGGVGASSLGTCGALTGACMFLSLLYGRERDSIQIPDPEHLRFKGHTLCSRVLGKFLQLWGSCECREIQKKNFQGKWFKAGDPKQMAEFQALGGHTYVCPNVVGKAVMWSAEVILEEETVDK
jgi:C_GCAxxG_C_C family probable redox protein